MWKSKETKRPIAGIRMIFNTFFLGCKMAKCIIIKGRGGGLMIYMNVKEMLKKKQIILKVVRMYPRVEIQIENQV